MGETQLESISDLRAVYDTHQRTHASDALSRREVTYAAYSDGTPVSFGRVELSPDNPFGSIWGGSTLPGHRGHGFYTALVAARLQEAAQRGRRYFTLDAKPDTSMPILQKLGFVAIGYATAFTWAP